MEFTIKSIGFIETPFEEYDDAPIQPGFSDAFGTVCVNSEYKTGLKDLDGFSHIILLYYFDRSEEENLIVKPFLDDEPKGIFAIRHFNRPNHIGLSVVRLIKIEGCKLLVKGIDVLNNTPLIDIKPFVPEFDLKDIEDCKVGWLEKRKYNKDNS